MSSSSKSPQQPNELFKYELGTGVWAWGDKLFWEYGKEYGEEDAFSVFKESLDLNINFFDTSESYGSGESERLLGKFIGEVKKPVFVATKFMPYPWRLTRSSLRSAITKSLKRLGLPHVNLYQIHFPNPPIPQAVWVEEMAKLQLTGLIGSIGVSNFNLAQTENAIVTLRRFGLRLASIQVEYNLLNKSIELNGLLSLCNQEGIRVIAYSPLAQGILTGKYSPEKPPSGIRGGRYHNLLTKVGPLISQLRKLGDLYGGRTPAAVAINWAICKGALPIPGAKTVQQLIQNAAAIGWKLKSDEVSLLDELSEDCQLGL